MSKQYPGGIISKTAPVPSGPYETSTASGIWTLDQQAYWRKLNQWPIAGNPPPDAQFNYVTMLLHGDGTNGAQNNTFLDSSTNNFTITRNGNTTQGSFSPYGSNWSNFFAGSDYLSLADNANLNPSTQDFVMEAWVYLTGTTGNNQGINGKGTAGTDGYTLFVTNALVLSFAWNGTGGATITGGTLVLNTWNHVAVVRNSSVIRLYLNGVGAASSTACTTDITSTATKFVGQARGGNPILGYMSNYRMTKGSLPSGYNATSSTLTVPTAPLTAISGTSLLTCADNRFVDDSTNNFTITVNGTPSVQRFNPFGASTAYSTSVIGGSGYFDGTGDYLSVADNASLELGSSDFCIEGWYFPQSFAANLALVSKRANTTSIGAAIIYANSGSGALTFYASTNGSSYFWSGTTVGTMVLNQWNHFAVYRSGNNWYGAMNGVVSSMGSNSSSIYNNTDAWTLGGDTNGNYANGYIASSRIVIGSAVYGASNFTPPTSPLTAITNTALLANYTNGAIFDNAMMNNLETVGNAQISTSVVKYGTGSLAFDGTGDYLVTPYTDLLQFNSGNFTIECWAYLTTSNSTNCIIGNARNSDGSGGWLFYVDTSRYLGFYFTANGSFGTGGLYLSSSQISFNTWTHLAVTRSGSSFYLFINGVLVATNTSATAIYNSTRVITVASDFAGASDASWTGYIDDLRITKGYARYTATFTPPTSAFSNFGPT